MPSTTTHAGSPTTPQRLDPEALRAPRGRDGLPSRVHPTWVVEQVADGVVWSLCRQTPVIGPAFARDGRTLHEVTFLAEHDGEVLLHLNSFVDRHRDRLEPAILERVPGTDMHHLTLELPTELLASYRLVSADRIERDAGSTHEGWVEIHHAGRPDPRNPDTLPHPRGEQSSLLRMPGAPRHPAWQGVRLGVTPTPYDERELHVDGTRVRLLAPRRPQRLLVLFDDIWHAAMLPEALAMRESMRHDGVAVAIVDPGTNDERWALLPNPERVGAVVRALVPIASASLGIPLPPSQVIASGVSFGGLAAAGLAVHDPDVVGSAVVLSGSFQFRADGTWLQDTDESGDLTQWVAGRELDTRMTLSVGSEEDMLAEHAIRFVDVARAAGATVDATVWAGGHDVAWWRLALLSRLDDLLDQE